LQDGKRRGEPRALRVQPEHQPRKSQTEQSTDHALYPALKTAIPIQPLMQHKNGGGYDPIRSI